ncbi:hypothetical protein [Fodinibius sp.]
MSWSKTRGIKHEVNDGQKVTPRLECYYPVAGNDPLFWTIRPTRDNLIHG